MSEDVDNVARNDVQRFLFFKMISMDISMDISLFHPFGQLKFVMGLRSEVILWRLALL